MFKDNISLGVFECMWELARQSKELFGVKLWQGGISSVCLANCKSLKKYKRRYSE